MKGLTFGVIRNPFFLVGRCLNGFSGEDAADLGVEVSTAALRAVGDTMCVHADGPER